jgi:AAA domain-containing protein/bifunctional DNA primase/polymerase-like protein
VSCLQQAILWHQAGACVIQAKTDGSKRPIGEWKQYQKQRPNLTAVVDWFSGGHPGIGLVMGGVSGNLEMLEFEGRAVEAGLVEQFCEVATNTGLGEVWTSLLTGYVEDTPSGGMHFIYRLSNGTAIGNTKLANRPATPEELAEDPGTKVKVLIETRGEGGFVVVAPSSGPVHPSGKPWTGVAAEPGRVAEITAEEAHALFDIARTFDTPVHQTTERLEFFDLGGPQSKTEGLTPGDDYEIKTPWEEILFPHGWKWVFKQGHTSYWRRPGKDIGISATTGNADDRDRLYVFSTSTVFEAEKPYTKFAAYTMLNHCGDYSAAARELASEGYGEKREKPTTPKALNGEAVSSSELRTIKATSLQNVQDEDTYWLWQHRIPMADFTIVGGRAGIGKSLFLATLTAWITTGDIRGQFDGTPRNVIFVANEDSYPRTVVPRMRAAGADMSRVFRLDIEYDGDPAHLMLPKDLELLGQVVKEHDAVAVIIDPVSSNMMDKDRNSPEVRASYERLRTFAEIAEIAVIGNGHLKKGQYKDFLEGFMGSSEIGNVARAAIGIALDGDAEERTVVLSQCKNNNGPMDLKSYTYQVAACAYERPDGSEGEAPKLLWGASTDRHVNDILSEPSSMDNKSEAHECREWLKDYLRINDGGVPRTELVKEGYKQGYKEYQVKNAGRAVAVSKNKPGVYPRTTLWYPKSENAATWREQ